MRYAIISDIHGNLEAFVAALETIDTLGVDKIVCLGDIVGYNSNPEECVDLMRRKGIITVLGNHDSRVVGLDDPKDFNALAEDALYWTMENLSAENIAFLRSLPRSRIVDGCFLAVHGWVNDTDRYVFGAMDALRNFNILKISGGINVCFFGHTHVAISYIEDHGAVKINADQEIAIEKRFNYLINPGGLGQPRDRDPRAPFLIYDVEAALVQFHRVPYDLDKTIRKISKVGLPGRLGERLRQGW